MGSDMSLKDVVNQLERLEQVPLGSPQAAHKAMDDLKKISNKIKNALEGSSESSLSAEDKAVMKNLASAVEELEKRFRENSSTSRALARMNELLGKKSPP